MSTVKVDCLIVGAGPTGLSLGVGLLKAGRSVLIVEKHKAHQGFFKAILILVNSCAISVLKKLGIAHRLEETGIRVDGVSFYAENELVCTAQFDTSVVTVNHPIALPQEVTERCIENLFLTNGGRLMRGVSFEKTRNDFADYKSGQPFPVVLQTSNSELHVQCDWLFGCDGMHSFPFSGVTLTERRYIIDAVIKAWPLPTQVNLWLGENSAQSAILISTTPLALRIFGSTREECRRALRLFEMKMVVWDGSFINTFRVADSYGRGRIWLAGDAVHVHSPIGGRGMNYGILDGAELAMCVQADTVQRYESARRPIARAWVWYNFYIAQVILSDALLYRLLRRVLLVVLRVLAYLLGPVLAKTMFEKMTSAKVQLRRE